MASCWRLNELPAQTLGGGGYGRPDTTFAEDRRCVPDGLRHWIRAARSVGIATYGGGAANHHLRPDHHGDGFAGAHYYDSITYGDNPGDGLAQPLYLISERQDAQLRWTGQRARSAHAGRRVPLRVSGP